MKRLIAIIALVAAISPLATAQDGVNAELLVAIQALSAKMDNLNSAVTSLARSNQSHSLPAPVVVASGSPADACGTELGISIPTSRTLTLPSLSVSGDQPTLDLSLLHYLYGSGVRTTPLVETAPRPGWEITLRDRLFMREKFNYIGPYLLKTRPGWFRTRLEVTAR